MCALNVLKNEKIVKKKYEDLRDAAFNTMNTKNITMEGLNKCRDVITDTTKKLKWLRMVKNVDVTTDIIKDEYGNSNVFHQNVKDPIPKTLLELNDDIKNSIDNYLDKC